MPLRCSSNCQRSGSGLPYPKIQEALLMTLLYGDNRDRYI